MKLTEVSKGIPHIEDLPVLDFIDTLLNWDILEATEKLDGAQILFGIDDIGFYTSRESKGGKRVYKESDYAIAFPTTYLRSVHKLLEQSYMKLWAAGMRSGDQVEAEVLFGAIPNVVPYSENTNYLIFLRTTEGNINIESLKQELCPHSLYVALDTPSTPDGCKIHISEDYHTWTFGTVPKIPPRPDAIMECSNELDDLMNFLQERVIGYEECTNSILESLPLNRIPTWCEPKDWKTVKLDLREKRDELNEEIMRRKMLIKHILVDHYVREQISVLGPPPSDGGWIEGVVLKNPVTGKMVKIVDKDTFGVVREAAWEERNKLTEAAKGTGSAHSFLANLYLDMATALGHPELGTIQAKAYLRRQGMITEERLQNLSNGIDFKEVSEYWLGLLAVRESNLHDRLDKYDLNWSTVVEYHVHQRTLDTFATTFQKITRLIEGTEAAKTPEDLFQVLVGKQLGEI